MVNGSASRTFRFSAEALDLLSTEAKEQKLSTNEVVNQLVLKDLVVKRLSRVLNPILVPALTLKLLFENISDQKVIEIAEKVANDVLVREIPLEMNGALSVESLLGTMKLFHEVTESVHNGNKAVIITHHCGQKYSLFLGSSFKALCASVGTNVEFYVDDAAIICKLPLGP